MTSQPIEASATEATGGIFEEVALALGEDINEKITTTEGSDKPETTTSLTEDGVETTTTATKKDSADVKEEEEEEEEKEGEQMKEEEEEEKEDSLNEIDTEGFVVSQDTLESAKKYGYKILLKKVRTITSRQFGRSEVIVVESRGRINSRNKINWLSRWTVGRCLWPRSSLPCPFTTTTTH